MQRLVLPLLALALLASLAGNYVLYQTSEQYYWQLNGTRLDPLGLSSYPSGEQPKPSSLGQSVPRVVMMGDSRAFAWPKPELPVAYEYINRGVGAQTSAQVIGRFDAHVRPLQPNIVILQVGINDLKTIPLFPDAKQQIIDQCKQNIAQLVERSLASGADVLVTTVFPHGAVSIQRSFFWSVDVTQAVVEVNQFLAEMASERVYIFDSASILADEAGTVQAEYQYDLLHLNPQGYAALNQALQPLLESIINK